MKLVTRKSVFFVGCALGTGAILLLIEHWYVITYGIENRTPAVWLSILLEGGPYAASIIASGNVHQGSTFGYLIGFVVQWTLVGILAYCITAKVREARKKE